MDVLLTSCRALPAQPSMPHWSQRAAGAVAASLAATPGITGVRWLCALGEAEAAPVCNGVEVIPVRGATEPFGQVQERLDDATMDRELTIQMRSALPDAVHCFGNGAPGSAALPWVAERMGRAAIVSVRAPEVLCHRLDLRHPSEPATCGSWDDPQRCLACCRVIRPGPALAPEDQGAGLTALGFQNRWELSVGNLLPARAVLVADESDRDRLIAAGLSKAKVHRVAALDAPAAALYGGGAGD